MKEIIISIALVQIVLLLLVAIIATPVYAFTDLTLSPETVIKYVSLLPLSFVIFISGMIAIGD